MSGEWRGSNRNTRLPNDWNTRRQRVFKRDGYVCQLAYEGCTYDAEECDHVINNDDHTLSNLQSVCGSCHSIKSSLEGQAAMRKQRAMEKREKEKHPGLL